MSTVLLAQSLALRVERHRLRWESIKERFQEKERKHTFDQKKKEDSENKRENTHSTKKKGKKTR